MLDGQTGVWRQVRHHATRRGRTVEPAVRRDHHWATFFQFNRAIVVHGVIWVVRLMMTLIGVHVAAKAILHARSVKC
jgi:hypothetical protein